MKTPSGHKNNPSNTYLFKVSDRNTRKRCEISSKLTIKTLVFILLPFEHIFASFSDVSIVDFEQVNFSWEEILINLKHNFTQDPNSAQRSSTPELNTTNTIGKSKHILM